MKKKKVNGAVKKVNEIKIKVNEKVNKELAKLDLKSERDIYDQCIKLLKKWMPKAYIVFENAIQVSMKEEQDFLIILFGPPGKGKSNVALLLCHAATKIVNEFFNINRTFEIEEQIAWLGSDYIQLFDEPAEKFQSLLESRDEDQLNEMISESRGKIWLLDEAKDLSAIDFLSTFNKSFSGILATCRALQFIYILCIDTPTKIIPDIREMRVNMGFYNYITPDTFKFPDGKIRNKRASAVYGRKEWSRMVFDDNKKIRSRLLMPIEFIKRYRPYCTEYAPMFPQGKEWKEYKMLKFGSMGRILAKELDRIRRDMKKKNRRPEVPGSKLLREMGYL